MFYVIPAVVAVALACSFLLATVIGQGIRIADEQEGHR